MLPCPSSVPQPYMPAVYGYPLSPGVASGMASATMGCDRLPPSTPLVIFENLLRMNPLVNERGSIQIASLCRVLEYLHLTQIHSHRGHTIHTYLMRGELAHLAGPLLPLFTFIRTHTSLFNIISADIPPTSQEKILSIIHRLTTSHACNDESMIHFVIGLPKLSVDLEYFDRLSSHEILCVLFDVCNHHLDRHVDTNSLHTIFFTSLRSIFHQLIELQKQYKLSAKPMLTNMFGMASCAFTDPLAAMHSNPGSGDPWRPSHTHLSPSHAEAATPRSEHITPAPSSADVSLLPHALSHHETMASTLDSPHASNSATPPSLTTPPRLSVDLSIASAHLLEHLDAHAIHIDSPSVKPTVQAPMMTVLTGCLTTEEARIWS